MLDPSISPLTQKQHFVNLSVTNFSWDKTLFDGLQSKKLPTDEDLYSYSKFTTSNQNSAGKHFKEPIFHISGNYTTPEDQNQKSHSTTENSKQRDDVQMALQELNKRVAQDQYTIQQLQNTILEKDKMIVSLQRDYTLFQSETEHSIRQALSHREEPLAQRQIRKLQERITQMEIQLKQAEDQLRNSHRQLANLEQENIRVKKERLVFEQQYSSLEQNLIRLREQNEQLQQDKLDVEKDKTFVEVNQKSIIQQLSLKIEQLQNQNYLHSDRRLSHELIKDTGHRSSLSEHTKTRVNTNNDFESSHQQRFIDCIVNLVSSCQPTGVRPTLKQCWKLLKHIIQEYMELKRADSHRQVLKKSMGSLEERSQNSFKS